MTDERAAKVAGELSKAQLMPFVHDAAIQWCGEKERETSLDDVRYFQENWWWAEGLKARVVGLAVRRILENEK